MKYSKQREKILEVLNQNKIHPTAEKIYSLLLARGEKVGLATVYRNLKQLVESKKVLSVKTFEPTERFDGTLSPHYHFLCEKCNTVYDLPIEITQDLTNNTEKLGYSVTKYNIMISGICPNCKNKE